MVFISPDFLTILKVYFGLFYSLTLKQLFNILFFQALLSIVTQNTLVQNKKKQKKAKKRSPFFWLSHFLITLSNPLIVSLIFFFRENPHVSLGAQPQSPAQNQNQQQFQHIKASKSMDLGTSQSQHYIGGETYFVYLLCMMAACTLSSFWNHPTGAWLLRWPQNHMQTDIRTGFYWSCMIWYGGPEV